MSPSSPQPTDRELHDIFRALRAWMDATYPDNVGIDILVHQLGRKPTRIAVPHGPRISQQIASEPTWWHSPDYREVRWHKHVFRFSKSRAGVVELLDMARDSGTPCVQQAVLLREIDSDATRLSDLFRTGDGLKAWGTLIVQGDEPGTYRLADRPPEETTSGRTRRL